MIRGRPITKELIEQNIGNYILLGGQGYIDGIKSGLQNYKSYALIIKFETYDGFNRMYVRKYRKHDLVYLPEFSWDQEYVIISPKEYRGLKKGLILKI